MLRKSSVPLSALSLSVTTFLSFSSLKRQASVFISALRVCWRASLDDTSPGTPYLFGAYVIKRSTCNLFPRSANPNTTAHIWDTWQNIVCGLGVFGYVHMRICSKKLLIQVYSVSFQLVAKENSCSFVWSKWMQGQSCRFGFYPPAGIIIKNKLMHLFSHKTIIWYWNSRSSDPVGCYYKFTETTNCTVGHCLLSKSYYFSLPYLANQNLNFMLKVHF